MFENIKWYKKDEALEFLFNLGNLLDDKYQNKLVVKFFLLYNKRPIDSIESCNNTILQQWKYFRNINLNDIYIDVDNDSAIQRVSEIFISGRVFDIVEGNNREKSYSLWKEVDLSRILIKNIKIGDKVVNLWDNYLTIDTQLFQEEKLPIDQSGWHLDFGTCSNLESYFEIVLGCGQNEMAKKYKDNKIVILLSNKPIGVMKFIGEEETMVASRTVINQNGEVLFYKGMVYALSAYNQFFSNIFDTRYLVWKLIEHWRSMNIDQSFIAGVNLDDLENALDNAQPGNKIIKNNLRWVRSVEIVRALEELTKNIENGEIDLAKINLKGVFKDENKTNVW